MKYYDGAIEHFENLPKEVLKQLPKETIFGFDYFPNRKPNLIMYDKLPKNGLILSHARDMKEDRLIDELEILKGFAEALEVSPPPIIFQGTLNTDQKNKIIEFLNTPYKDLVDEFELLYFQS